MKPKNIAVLCHIAGFLGGLYSPGNIIAPCIIWQLNKNKELVDSHGREAVNFQISMFCYIVILAICTSIGDNTLKDAEKSYSVARAVMGGILYYTASVATVVLKYGQVFFIIMAWKAARAEKEYRYPIAMRPLKKKIAVKK